jgi:hypothetical protein
MKVHTAHDGERTILRFDPKMGKKRATLLRAGMPIAHICDRINVRLKLGL